MKKEDPRFPPGLRFGVVTVAGFERSKIDRNMMVTCQCICGKVWPVRKRSLLIGRTKSCGCRGVVTITKPLARSKLKWAIKIGKIKKPSNCSECGIKTRSFGLHGHHHAGYNRPLDIKWLCPKCHYKADAEIRPKTGENNPNSVFSNETAYSIRRRAQCGEKRSLLAKEFNVCLSTIDTICQNRTYHD